MALIRCPDCGVAVSDRAKACPKCGRPVETWEGDCRAFEWLGICLALVGIAALAFWHFFAPWSRLAFFAGPALFVLAFVLTASGKILRALGPKQHGR